MRDVIVIGAGVAGLTATRELLEAGLSVSLFEAKSRSGGRLYAEEAGGGGNMLELGGQFFRPGRCPELQHEIERYSLDVTLAPASAKQYVYVQDQVWDLSDALERSPGELLAFLRIVKRDVAALDVDGVASCFHALSVDAYLQQFTFTPVIGTWLRAWVEQYAGNTLDEIAAASMLKLVSATGGALRGASHNSAHVIMPSTANLTDALTRDTAAALKTGTVVTTVKRHDSGSGFVVETSEGPEEAKAVVVAVPRNVISSGGLHIDIDVDDDARVALTTPQPGYGYKTWARVEGNVPERTMVLGDMGGFRLLSTGDSAADGSNWAVLFANKATLGDNARDLDRWTRFAVNSVWGDSVRVLEVQFHDWVADPLAKGAWTVTGIESDSPIVSLHTACPPDMAFAGADYALDRGGVESALRSAKDAAVRTRNYVNTIGSLSNG